MGAVKKIERMISDLEEMEPIFKDKDEEKYVHVWLNWSVIDLKALLETIKDLRRTNALYK